MRVLQTDERLDDEIRHYGCAFRSHLALCETRTGGELTAEQIQEIKDRLVRYELLGPECTILRQSPVAILRAGFDALGRPDLAGWQMGSLTQDGYISFWSGGGRIDGSIIHYNARTNDGHFIEGDQWLQPRWNPDPTAGITTIRKILFYQIGRRN